MSDEPIVFVTQLVMKYDEKSGEMVRAVNISKAEEYGKIHILAKYGESIYSGTPLLDRLRKDLMGYDYGRGDCIVCLGDPTIIAAVGAILGKYKGAFRILKWDKKLGRYLTGYVQGV